jgi:hypothetical protein
MYLTDSLTRHRRVDLDAQTGSDGPGGRPATRRGSPSQAERARQRRSQRFDHDICGHCWNPR